MTHIDIRTKVSGMTADKKPAGVNDVVYAEYVGTPERRSRTWSILVELVGRCHNLEQVGPTCFLVVPNKGYTAQQGLQYLTAAALFAQSEDWTRLATSNLEDLLEEIEMKGGVTDMMLIDQLRHEFLASKATNSLENQLRGLASVSYALNMLNKWRNEALEKRERLRDHDAFAANKLLDLVEQINGAITRGKSLQTDMAETKDTLNQRIKEFAGWSRKVRLPDLMAEYNTLSAGILAAIADSEKARKEFIPSATFIQEKILPQIQEV